jgi:hypothetical protein
LRFWDYENNSVLPQNIGFKSAKKVSWKCEFGHSFSRIVHVVTRNKHLSCPVCKSLEFARPEIAKEWDFEKNLNLTPADVTYGSTKKVWWICPKGHSYKASVGHRSDTKRPTGCPVCFFKSKENTP